jgi:hypothetical protein
LLVITRFVWPLELPLIAKGVLAPGGVTIEIAGRLNALLGEQAYPNNVRGVWGKMVAGERYIQSPTQFEPLFSKTYRAA